MARGKLLGNNTLTFEKFGFGGRGKKKKKKRTQTHKYRPQHLNTVSVVWRNEKGS